jgi:hypothetical protein
LSVDPKRFSNLSYDSQIAHLEAEFSALLTKVEDYIILAGDSGLNALQNHSLNEVLSSVIQMAYWVNKELEEIAKPNHREKYPEMKVPELVKAEPKAEPKAEELAEVGDVDPTSNLHKV